MRNLTIIAFLILVKTNVSFGQSNFEELSTIICEKLGTINLNKDIKTLNKETVSLVQKTYQENQNLTRKILTDLKNDYKNKTDLEISKVLGQKITFSLMKNCEVYQRITMFKNEPTIKISETTENVGLVFTRILNEKIKKEKISYEIVNKSMLEAMKIKEKELIKNFGSLFSDNFTKEFFAFLMTKCEAYMIWTASLLN